MMHSPFVCLGRMTEFHSSVAATLEIIAAALNFKKGDSKFNDVALQRWELIDKLLTPDT